MGLADELRKNTYRKREFEGLEYQWKCALEKASRIDYTIGEEHICVNCVAGYLEIKDYVDDKFISTSEIKVREVWVPGYDSVKQSESLNNSKLFEVGYMITYWDEGTHNSYIKLDNILSHKEIEISDENVPLNTSFDKFDCFPRGNFYGGFSHQISLFTNEEDAFKVAGIIQSCDDGGFKKFEVKVQKIEFPEYAERYVSKIIQYRSPGGIFTKGAKCKYEVACRTVGKRTAYAVYFDIRW